MSPPRPFPTSLCHQCDAPIKFVTTKTSTFILCPRVEPKYPAQPVRTCVAFSERKGGAAEPPPADDVDSKP